MMESMLKDTGYGPDEQESRRKRSEISQSDQLISCSSAVTKKNIEDGEDQEGYLSNQSSNTDSSARIVLPREMIYEILHKVSLNQLICQLPLLCKELRSFACGSNLKHLHSQTTPTLYGYMVHTLTHSVADVPSCRTSFDFISFNNQSPSTSKIRTLNFSPDCSNHLYLLQIVSPSSPHGLFCCLVFNADYSMCNPECYCICKPATGEFQMIPLPNSNLNSLSSKIVIDVVRCSPLHYKIFRFSSLYGPDMFDSQRGKWTTLETTADYLSLPKNHQYLDDTAVIVHGAVNWLTGEGQICSLKFREYTWKVIDIPKDEELQDMFDRFGDSVENKLVECEGELGLMISSSSRRWLELWVLKNLENVMWKKNYRVSLEPVFQNKKISFIKVLDYYTTDIVLMMIGDDIIWFDWKNGSYSVAERDVNSRFGRVYKIHSDFIPCNMTRKIDPELESESS